MEQARRFSPLLPHRDPLGCLPRISFVRAYKTVEALAGGSTDSRRWATSGAIGSSRSLWLREHSLSRTRPDGEH
jgi:hypothetical protein